MIQPTAVTDHHLSRVLQIDWADDTSSRLRHALLRENCRCAQCEQLRRQNRLPEIDPEITLVTLQPVGEHGLSLGFSDGHARGIYPWAYLRGLGDGSAPT